MSRFHSGPCFYQPWLYLMPLNVLRCWRHKDLIMFLNVVDRITEVSPCSVFVPATGQLVPKWWKCRRVLSREMWQELPIKQLVGNSEEPVKAPANGLCDTGAATARTHEGAKRRFRAFVLPKGKRTESPLLFVLISYSGTVFTMKAWG